MESAYAVAFVDESQFVGGCSGGTVRRWKIEDRQEQGLIDSAMAAPQSFLLPLPRMGDGSWPEMNSWSSGTRSLMKKCTCSHQAGSSPGRSTSPATLLRLLSRTSIRAQSEFSTSPPVTHCFLPLHTVTPRVPSFLRMAVELLSSRLITVSASIPPATVISCSTQAVGVHPVEKLCWPGHPMASNSS